jgi:hypothetical protein
LRGPGNGCQFHKAVTKRFGDLCYRKKTLTEIYSAGSIQRKIYKGIPHLGVKKRKTKIVIFCT